MCFFLQDYASDTLVFMLKYVFPHSIESTVATPKASSEIF